MKLRIHVHNFLLIWYNEIIMREKYETDLTDEQWTNIEPFFKSIDFNIGEKNI